MRIKKKPKFALVGHRFHLHFMFNELIKNKLPIPIIITHKKTAFKRYTIFQR